MFVIFSENFNETLCLILEINYNSKYFGSNRTSLFTKIKIQVVELAGTFVKIELFFLSS